MQYPWLKSYRESIAASLKQGRFPHALLLSGQSGTGKTYFANYLARLLLCEQPLDDASHCGQCSACKLFRAGSHPDYFTLQPEEDSSVIKVDQVRGLIENLSLSSHHGGYKVVIINPADRMNVNAANSLLKTLEEPSDNTVLVLVSDQPGHLPATLRSRCQQLRLGVQDKALALQWLSGQENTSEPKMYLQLAGYAPLEALRLSQENTLEARQAAFSSLIDILDGKATALSVALAWSKDEDMQGIRWMRDWLMDLLKIRMTGQSGAVSGLDVINGLEALAPRLDCKTMFRQLDSVTWALQQAGSSLNRQLVTEDILLEWAAQT